MIHICDINNGAFQNILCLFLLIRGLNVTPNVSKNYQLEYVIAYFRVYCKCCLQSICWVSYKHERMEADLHTFVHKIYCNSCAISIVIEDKFFINTKLKLKIIK